MNRLPLLVASALAVLSIVVGVIFFVFLRQTWPVEEVPFVPAEETVVRGPNWERRKNPDGTVSQTFTAGVSNYQTESGSFEPIDTTLSPAPDGGGYQNTTNTVRSSYKAELQSEALNNIVKSTIGGVEVVSGFVDNELGAVNRNVVSEVEDNQITYKNVYPGVDVRYTVLPGGVLEEFVLQARTSPVTTIESLTQEISLNEGSLQAQNDGSLAILDQSGEPVGFFPPPLMYEEKNDKEENLGISYQLNRLESGRYQLSKVLTAQGQKWLSNPQRDFPVVIDASVSSGSSGDGYLYRQCSGTTYQDCRNSAIQSWVWGFVLYLGQRKTAPSDWWLGRSYASFNTGDAIPDNATINSATLYMTVRHDTSDPDFDIKFYSGDWGDLDSGDWNTGATLEGVFLNTTGVQRDQTYSRSVSPSSIDKVGLTQFRFTSSREEVGSEPSGYEDLSFYPSRFPNNNFKPRLEVTFTGVNNPPNIPSNPSPSSGSTNQSVFTDLSWTGGDPDAGDTVRYDVYLKAGDSNFGGPVSSNQAATTYDPGTLAYGTTYYWKIVAKDGFGATSSSPVWNFSTAAAPTGFTTYSQTSDGMLQKYSYGEPSCISAYSKAAASVPNVVLIPPDEHPAGTHPGTTCFAGFYIRRIYLSFDTSSLVGQSVQSASVYLTKSEIATDESLTRFEVYIGPWGGSLDSGDWGSGTKYQNYFDATINDPDGTVYHVPLRPEDINTSGLTQLEVLLYDEAGTTGFYGSERERILATAGRYRVFYAGDASPASLRPTLKVNTAEGCNNSAPDSPTLSSPTDGAGGVLTSPTLSWNEVSSWGVNCAGNDNSYEVFLSDNQGMVQSMDASASQGIVLEGTASMGITGLTNNTTYYWRVRAANGNPAQPPPVGASDIWEFTTEAAAALPALSVSPTVLNFSTAYGDTSTVTCDPTGADPDITCPLVQNNVGGTTLSWNTGAATGDDFGLVWLPVSHTGNSLRMSIFVTPADSSGDPLAVGSYQKQFTISCDPSTSCQAGSQSRVVTVNLIIASTTGTISGFVWEDMGAGPHAGSGLKDADEDFYIDQSVEISCVSSGPSGYSQAHNTDTLNDGRYVCDNVPAGEEITVSLNPSTLPSGLYPSGPMLDGGVCINGGNNLCRITINAGDSHEISFGIWDNSSSGWMQVKDGDVYAASVSISIPSTTAEYEQWFIADTSAGGTRGGVAVAAGLISCNTYTSERGWEVASYSGGIGWPNLTASSGPIVINHMGDLTVDPAYISSNGLNSGLHVVVVDGGNLTITGDVKGSTNPNDYQIYAVLIVKGGQIIVQDSDNGNDQLKIKGALYAENGFDLTARTLSNNQKPAIVVEYEPSYILQTIPGLTTSGVSWREVR